MRIPVLTVVAAVALAGCGGGNESQEPAANDAAAASGMNYQAEVAALQPAQRNVVFIRAIRDAGIQCQGVTESEALPEAGVGVWRARCQNGADHVIRIKPDGMAEVVSSSRAQ